MVAGKDVVNGVKSVQRVIAVAGPVLAVVSKLISDHPDVWARVKSEIPKLLKSTGNSPEALLATIEVLRGQVTYLADSADDEAESAAAAAWAKQLDSYERAARLLATPGKHKKERVELKRKVDALRSEIFSAFIRENSEDAEEGEAPAPAERP
jgi:hypothetical protein